LGLFVEISRHGGWMASKGNGKIFAMNSMVSLVNATQGVQILKENSGSLLAD
jgi:hypothetical protein